MFFNKKCIDFMNRFHKEHHEHCSCLRSYLNLEKLNESFSIYSKHFQFLLIEVFQSLNKLNLSGKKPQSTILELEMLLNSMLIKQLWTKFDYFIYSHSARFATN